MDFWSPENAARRARRQAPGDEARAARFLHAAHIETSLYTRNMPMLRTPALLSLTIALTFAPLDAAGAQLTPATPLTR